MSERMLTVGGLSGAFIPVSEDEGMIAAARSGVLTLDKLVELMAGNPRKRFGFPLRADDYAVWDLNAHYRIDPAQFCSMGKSTPFAGQTVYGRCVRNVCGGAVVWQDAQV